MMTARTSNLTELQILLTEVPIGSSINRTSHWKLRRDNLTEFEILLTEFEILANFLD